MFGARIWTRQSRRFDLDGAGLTEACSFACYDDSAHPTYLESICIHLDVAQIWVVHPPFPVIDSLRRLSDKSPQLFSDSVTHWHIYSEGN